MFAAEDIRAWRGREVIDPDGRRIGKLETVYRDTASDEPVFAAVRIGIPGRRRLALVPLLNASVGPSHVRVRAERSLVKDAPSIEQETELRADEEPDVFRHYGISYTPGAGGERRLARG